MPDDISQLVGAIDRTGQTFENGDPAVGQSKTVSFITLDDMIFPFVADKFFGPSHALTIPAGRTDHSNGNVVPAGVSQAGLVGWSASWCFQNGSGRLSIHVDGIGIGLCWSR